MQGFPGIFCYILGVKRTDLVTLNKNTIFGTNVLLVKEMYRMQDPGLYLKGEGHNHRSKVKKLDILL